MRIGFDLDGCLVDLHSVVVQTALRLFPQLTPAAITSRDGSPVQADGAVTEESRRTEAATRDANVAMTLPQSKAVWKHLGSIENFWETIAETEPGSVARLAALAEERRWEILFLTSRPPSAGLTVQRQSQRWLQRMGFPLPSCFVVHGSRGRVAQALALDVVVDDRPENCQDVVLESQAGAILVWRHPQAGLSVPAPTLGIAVVPTVTACLDALVAADGPGSADGLLDRLRRLFGLKTGSPSSPFRSAE